MDTEQPDQRQFRGQPASEDCPKETDSPEPATRQDDLWARSVETDSPEAAETIAVREMREQYDAECLNDEDIWLMRDVWHSC